MCRCYFLMIRRPPRCKRTVHSFPTRRSSDLRHRHRAGRLRQTLGAERGLAPLNFVEACPGRKAPAVTDFGRSEEHTSELQSLMRHSYAVVCLKKTNT